MKEGSGIGAKEMLAANRPGFVSWACATGYWIPVENNHSCHQKFIFSRLERVKNRKKKEVDSSGSARKSKRQSLETDKNLCLFCGISTSEKLIEYSTNNAKANLHRMAIDLDDTLQKYPEVTWLQLKRNTHTKIDTKPLYLYVP